MTRISNLRWLLPLLMMVSGLAQAFDTIPYDPNTFDRSKYAHCSLLQTECVSTGTKTFGGQSVTRDCWEYESIYSCITESINYCQPFEDEGCSEISRTCAERDHRDVCIRYTKQFQCGTELDPPPTNTQKIDDVLVITEDSLDYSQCEGDPQDDPYCTQADRVCVEGPETRVINGKEVYKDCWAWDDTYHCLGEWNDTCADLEADEKCSFKDQECFSTTEIAGASECTASTRTYECSEEGASRVFESCGSTELCADGNCFDTSSPSAADDFLRAATSMEAARQAGEYFNEDAFQLFKGKPNDCRSWLRFGSILSVFGDPNCCNAGEGTAQSNQSVMGQAAKGAGKAILEEGYSVASNYMYDYMFESGTGWMADKAVDAWFTGAWGGSSSFQPSFGMYGFNVSFGGTVSGTTLFSGGGFTVGFDPVSFAVAVGVYVIQQWVACPEDEIITGGKVDADLCHFTGEHCTKDMEFIGCLRKHATYCCFNSKLARIIQEQGRPQLGISWGSPGSQNCRGLTPQEFEQLDFSQIDMSEFYEDVLREVEVPDSSTIEAVVEKNKQTIQEKTSAMGN